MYTVILCELISFYCWSISRVRWGFNHSIWQCIPLFFIVQRENRLKWSNWICRGNVSKTYRSSLFWQGSIWAMGSTYKRGTYSEMLKLDHQDEENKSLGEWKSDSMSQYKQKLTRNLFYFPLSCQKERIWFVSMTSGSPVEACRNCTVSSLIMTQMPINWHFKSVCFKIQHSQSSWSWMQSSKGILQLTAGPEGQRGRREKAT